MTTPRRSLYPEVEAFETGQLAVSGGHSLYYEQAGNPEGKPVVFLHGGPGGGTDGTQRRFFDPAAYRIVSFDQRGCGQSTPHACLENNTTWDLVADIEALRAHLKIERWQVFGGSWGSALALAYAERHPEQVSELVLRGIFMLRPEEIQWFYQAGTSVLFPDAWEQFEAPIPPPEREDMLPAYHRRLTSSEPSVRLEAARAWSVWEARTSFLQENRDHVAHAAEDEFSLAFARIECHYFTNDGFFDRPSQLLEDINAIRHLPGVIVQGRYDVICPVRSAWDLARAWPEADLRIVPDAGHSALEPGMTHELICATDRFART